VCTVLISRYSNYGKLWPDVLNRIEKHVFPVKAGIRFEVKKSYGFTIRPGTAFSDSIQSAIPTIIIFSGIYRFFPDSTAVNCSPV
jgi:hypothetical protein